MSSASPSSASTASPVGCRISPEPSGRGASNWSKSTTRWPSRARSSAAESPAGPAPAMAIDKLCTSGRRPSPPAHSEDARARGSGPRGLPGRNFAALREVDRNAVPEFRRHDTRPFAARASAERPDEDASTAPRSTASTSPCGPASSMRCSGRTAPARRRRCGWSRGCSSRTPARSRSSASTRAPIRWPPSGSRPGSRTSR